MQAKKSIGKPNERFDYAIESLGITLEALARGLDMNPSHVSEIRNGRVPLTEKTARAMERAFGWQAEWLMLGTGPSRIAEDGEHYVAGPLSSRPPLLQVYDVIRREAFQCGNCHREVAPNIRICPHWGATLRWQPVPAAEK